MRTTISLENLEKDDIIHLSVGEDGEKKTFFGKVIKNIEGKNIMWEVIDRSYKKTYVHSYNHLVNLNCIWVGRYRPWLTRLLTLNFKIWQ